MYYNTVPSIDASPLVVVQTIQDYYDGLVTLSCIPSDPDAIIHWFTTEGRSFPEAFPEFDFLPVGLNHTVTLMEAPPRIEMLYCGLYNPSNDSLVNANTFTLLAVSCKYLRERGRWRGREGERG